MPKKKMPNRSHFNEIKVMPLLEGIENIKPKRGGPRKMGRRKETSVFGFVLHHRSNGSSCGGDSALSESQESASENALIFFAKEQVKRSATPKARHTTTILAYEKEPDQLCPELPNEKTAAADAGDAD